MFHPKKAALSLTLGYALVLVSGPVQAQFSWIASSIFDMERELSAWAVTTKQTGVAANQQAEADLKAKQQLATAVGTIGMSSRAVKAVTNFGASSGQPETSKCIAQANGSLHVEAMSQRDKDSARLMASFASERVGSKAAADAQRLALHRELYCTVAEAKSGLCGLTPNAMQGWDVNYGGAFSKRTLSPEGELAGYAYAAMLGDSRAEMQIDCKTASCGAAQSKQLAFSAMSSMVATSIVGQVTDRRVPMLTGN